MKLQYVQVRRHRFSLDNKSDKAAVAAAAAAARLWVVEDNASN
jgi:hypothetical protein